METQVHTLRAEWKHTVTRYRIRLLCFAADPVECHADSTMQTTADTEWVPVHLLATRPLSTTGRRLADLVTADTAAVNQPLSG